MRRFFTPPENISDDHIVIRGSDVAHIRDVLRLEPGDRIDVMDGRGNHYCAQLAEVKRKEVVGRILSRESVQTESPAVIRMGQALLKGNKLDNVFRKATELGVHSIVPLDTERCVVKGTDKDKKTARWRKIALEASKQCGRSVVPVVERTVQSLEAFCRDSGDCDVKIVFWENENATRLRDLGVQSAARTIAFATGPEGGLTEAEIETARRHGFKTVSLGPRTLRAETAPIVVLSILQNLWGDL